MELPGHSCSLVTGAGEEQNVGARYCGSEHSWEKSFQGESRKPDRLPCSESASLLAHCHHKIMTRARFHPRGSLKVQHHQDSLSATKRALYQLFFPMAGNLWLRNHSGQNFPKVSGRGGLWWGQSFGTMGLRVGTKKTGLGYGCLNVLDWKCLVCTNIWCVSTSGVYQEFALPDTVGFIWENWNFWGSVCAHLDDLEGQVETHCFLSWFFPYFSLFALKHLHLRTRGNWKAPA